MKKNCFARICLLNVLITSLFVSPNLRAALVAVWGDTNASVVPLPPGLVNVKAVAGGSGFTLALKADGTVAAWGRSDGRNDNALQVPGGLSNIGAIAAGGSHALALTAGGQVVAWGYGIFGETNVPVGLAKVTAIAAGDAHSLALQSDGTVVAWGSSSGGATNVPAHLSDVKAIAAGGSSLALRQDGTVVAWGSVPVPAGLSNVIAIAAGSDFSVALRSDGRVAAWGRNEFGQTNVPSDLSNVTAIAAGFARGLALRSDGSVVTWGRELVSPAIPSALSNVVTIAAGVNHNLALVHAGPPIITTPPQDQVAAFGSTATFVVGAAGSEPLSYQWLRNGEPLPDGGRFLGATAATLIISNVVAADAGTYAVVVRNELGSVLSFGASLTTGQAPLIIAQSPNQTVGAGTSVYLSVATEGTAPLQHQWAFHGTNLPGRTFNFLSLPNAQPAQSGNYTVATSNLFGTASATIILTVTNRAPVITQQPFLTTTNLRTTVTSPVPIGSSAVINVTAIGSAPLSYQWRFNGMNLPGATNQTLLRQNLTSSQSGYYSVEIANAFGVANSAKLLLNVASVFTTGTPFSQNTNMPLALADVTAVAAGGSHLVALKSDGTVRTWLANANFLFGLAYAVTNIPASVTNVIEVAAGYDHCLALRANGTVVAWGGQGTHTNVPAGLSNVVGIAAGWSRSYAVKMDGTVTGWGTLVAVPIGLSNVVAVAASSSHNLAVRRDGTVAIWTGSGSFSVMPGLSNIIAVAASGSINRALGANGTVWQWQATTPTLPARVFEGNYPVSNAVAIALGSGNTSLILKRDGTVIATGFQQTGGLPISSNVNAIAAGGVQSGFGVLLAGTGAPAFALQPVGQTVARSNTVSLHARSVGDFPQTTGKPPVMPPLRYQWQRDGVNVIGATNGSLVLSNVLGSQAGAYRVIASNLLGVATSRIAMVSIAVNTNLGLALNAANLTWITYGGTVQTIRWFAQGNETHDGEAAAQSGAIGPNQQTTLQTTVTGPGTLSFWWRVSSETGYDFLRFYTKSTATVYASISGETAWQEVNVPLAAGSHTLRWVYSKDGSVNNGRDAGWVDEVRFAKPLPKIVRHPFNQTVMIGSTATIPAYVTSTSPMAFQWLKNGTNLPGANAMYLTLTKVSFTDAGSYALRVTNDGGSVTSSNALLTVLPQLQLSAPQRLDNATVQLWVRLPGDPASGLSDESALAVQVSSNLMHWEILPRALVFTNNGLLLRDTTAAQHPQRFYRVVEQPPH